MDKKPTYEELVQRVEALEQADRKSRVWLENSPVSTKIIDLDYNLLYMSDAGVKGLKIEDVTQLYGKPFPFEFYPESFNKRMTTNLDRVKETGETVTQEAAAVDIEGNELWLHSTIVPINDDEGQIDNIMILSVDTTKSKRKEGELRKGEEKFRKYFELGSIGMITSNLEKNWLEVNERTCEILGYTHEEIMPLTWVELTHPDDIEADVANFNRVLSGETDGYSMDKRFIRKDGEVIHASISVTCIREKDGSIDYFLAFISDITENKKLENQLAQSQKLESLGTLAGGIAHDFNNMLGIILGNVNLLMLKIPEENRNERRYLERILKTVDRSADLVKQILTFSRKNVVQMQPLNTCLVVEEVLQMLKATIPTNIEVKEEISKTCRNVLADKTQIHQVVMNLATNAFHAMEEDGGVMTVTLKERDCQTCSVLGCPIKPYKACLQLIVRDTGHGMPQEDREKVFDPFFTTKEVNKGTGLGLAVTRSIVQDHKGVIVIDSEINKGTTVKVCFPVIEEKEEETIPKPTEDNVVKEGSWHILLVEDEASLAETYQEFLKESGYVVTVCTDGSAALRLFQEDPSQFDLVLTDQAMPRMTGKQLSQELLEIKQDIPIILSTGYSSVISEENADTIGIRRYLMKPIELATLRQAIEECLS